MNSTAPKDFSSRVQHALRLDELSSGVRKTIIGIIGGLILLAGIALLFLPGPAFVVIPLGLAILATEFAWARHYLKKAHDWFENAKAAHHHRKAKARSRKLAAR